MSEFVIVCDGYEDDRHQQVKLTDLRNGSLKVRGNQRCSFNETHQVWNIKCPYPSCRISASLKQSTLELLTAFFESNDQLTVTRIVPERFSDISLDLFPAIRLQTLCRVISKFGRIR